MVVKIPPQVCKECGRTFLVQVLGEYDYCSFKCARHATKKQREQKRVEDELRRKNKVPYHD